MGQLLDKTKRDFTRPLITPLQEPAHTQRPCTLQSLLLFVITFFHMNGQVEKAVNLFCQMNRKGVRPNDFTYSTIIAAHLVVSVFEVHAQAIKTDYVRSPTVGTALLDVYVKLGNVDEPAKVFQRIDEKDIVTWSATIAGYAQIGDTQGAVKTFTQMLEARNMPNEYTLSTIINACVAATASVE